MTCSVSVVDLRLTNLYVYARGPKKNYKWRKRDGRPVLDCPGAAFGREAEIEFRSVVLKKVSPGSEFGYANEIVCISKGGGRRHCNDFSDSIAMTTGWCVLVTNFRVLACGKSSLENRFCVVLRSGADLAFQFSLDFD
jgi:hypothetical protein